MLQLAFSAWCFGAGATLATAVALAVRLHHPAGRHHGRGTHDTRATLGVRRHDGTGRTHRRSVSACDRAARAAIAAEMFRPAPASHILTGRDERAARWRVARLLDDTSDITPAQLAVLLATGRARATAGAR